MGTDSRSTSNLPTNNLSILYVPVTVAHCSPLALMFNFHSAGTGAASIFQPQLIITCKDKDRAGLQRVLLFFLLSGLSHGALGSELCSPLRPIFREAGPEVSFFPRCLLHDSKHQCPQGLLPNLTSPNPHQYFYCPLSTNTLKNRYPLNLAPLKASPSMQEVWL